MKRLFRRLKAWWLRRLPLPEHDVARLAFLGGGYELSNGILDTVTALECLSRLQKMAESSRRWVVVVTITRERHEQWWVRLMMQSFGPPVSGIWLSDGRRAFCTWAPA